MDEHTPGLKERIAQFLRIRRPASRTPTPKSYEYEYEDLKEPVADLEDFDHLILREKELIKF